MAESREGVRKIDFNLIYLLESGTGRGPVPGLYNCSTIGYNWPKTETPADYLRGIATITVYACTYSVYTSTCTVHGYHVLYAYTSVVFATAYMYIQIYEIMNMYVQPNEIMYMYVHTTYNVLCSCTYMYIHVHDFMKLSEHVHTCLYYVQTRMYYFANSCPGGQDSRSWISSRLMATSGQVSLKTIFNAWPQVARRAFQARLKRFVF